MQILHWPFSCPHVSTGDFGGSTSLPIRFTPTNPVDLSSAIARGSVEPVELSNNRVETRLENTRTVSDKIMESLQVLQEKSSQPPQHSQDVNQQAPVVAPYFINSFTTVEETNECDIDSKDTSGVNGCRDPIVVAQGSERENPDDDDKPPGDHYKDYNGDGKGNKKPNPENNENDEEVEEEENNNEDDEDEEEERQTLIPYLCNNQDTEILRRRNHKSKAVLILNLYPPERGYTICCYSREEEGTDPTEIQVFKESHLIPYTETYLLDCINMEIIPLKLVEKFERIDGVNLMRYFSCVVCEIRDYRRFTSNLSKRNAAVVKKVLLRPTNHTLFSQLDTLIDRSFEDRKLYKQELLERENEQDSSDEDQDEECDLNLEPNNNIQHSPTAEEESEDSIPVKRRKINDSSLSSDLAQVETSEEQFPIPETVNLDHIGEPSRFSEQPRFPVQSQFISNDPDKLSFQERLELEKQIVFQSCTGLCLDPSKSVGLIANVRQFERFKWNTPDLKNAVSMGCRKHQAPLQIQNTKSSTKTNCENEQKKAKLGLTKRNNKLYDFSTFVKRAWKKLPEKQYAEKVNPQEAFNLPPVNYMDYPTVAVPGNLEELSRIGQPAETSILRPVVSENYIRKVDEYVLETERRKRPHTTKLSIFQRNGTESYYGELEQESFAEPSPITNFTNIQKGGPFFQVNGAGGQSPSTKCQFELGSMKNVQLYVRQFTDIFTEDGRRACKISYQKIGQTAPQVAYINDYANLSRSASGGNATVAQPSSAQNNNNSITSILNAKNNSSPTAKIPTTIPSVSVSAQSCANTLVSSSANSVSVPAGFVSQSGSNPATSSPPCNAATTQPPVQIVHPQPRSVQQAQISQSQIHYTSPQTATIIHPQSTVQATGAANVNLNLNVNSARIVHQQPILTRPQIINLNLHQQPTLNASAGNMNAMSKATTASTLHLQQQQQLKAAHAQTHQHALNNNNNLRLQQPTLATLLLNGPNSSPKPITVAIQPQPQQNQSVQLSNTMDQQQKQQQHIQQQINQIVHQTQQSQLHQQQQASQQPIMIMVSPPTNTSLGSPVTNGIHQHHNGSVSLNLNAISLDSLLNVNHSQQQNYVTTTSLVSSNSNHSTATALNRLNILRLSNNTSTVTLTPQQQQQLIRQNTVSLNMNPPNNSTATLMNTGIIITSTANTINQNQKGQVINNNRNSSGNRNAGAATVSIGPSKQTSSKGNNGNITTVTVPRGMEDLNVPDLHSLLSAPTVSSSASFRTQPGGTRTASIDGLNLDLNLNLNLNLGGPAQSSLPLTVANQGLGNDGTHLVYDAGNHNSSNMQHGEGVDSLFNALSEAIGPELGQRLDGSHSIMRQSSGNNSGNTLVSSSYSPTKSPANNNNNSVITLNDLLGSPPIMVSPSANQQTNGISPVQSPQSPSITSILSPISPSLGAQSNIAYSTTPRLSALLAGTPSADSTTILTSQSLYDATGRGTSISTPASSSSYGNLLDRLVASSSQSQATQRIGGSRLNPIATATPMLAASLAQGPANSRQSGGTAGLARPTAYRQIAPAPAPNSQSQSQQQLINLLGFVGNNNTSGSAVASSQQQTIRVNANNSSQGTSGNLGSR